MVRDAVGEVLRAVVETVLESIAFVTQGAERARRAMVLVWKQMLHDVVVVVGEPVVADRERPAFENGAVGELNEQLRRFLVAGGDDCKTTAGAPQRHFVCRRSLHGDFHSEDVERSVGFGRENRGHEKVFERRPCRQKRDVPHEQPAWIDVNFCSFLVGDGY